MTKGTCPDHISHPTDAFSNFYRNDSEPFLKHAQDRKENRIFPLVRN